MSNSLWLHQYQFHFICSKQQGIWLPSDHANVTYTRTSQHHLQLLFGHKMVWVHRVYQMTQRGLDCTASKCSTILSKCSINKPLGLVTLLLSFESRYNVNFKFKIGLYFWLVLYFDFSWATVRVDSVTNSSLWSKSNTAFLVPYDVNFLSDFVDFFFEMNTII